MNPLLLSLLISAPADTTLPAPVELESITIVAKQTDTHHAGAALVLDQKQLQRFQQVDANTALAGLPGLYASPEDGWGLRLNIGIRGTGALRSSRITLMEDGILTAPAPYSAPAAYYSPATWKYAQTEILKGSAQLISGPQSTGGAINFVLPTATEFMHHRVFIGAGNYGQGRAQFQGEVPLSQRTQLLYGFARQGASGFQQSSQGPTGGYLLHDGYVKLQHHLDNRDVHHLEVFAGGTQERSAQTYLGLTEWDALNTPNIRYAAAQNDSMFMDRFMVRAGYIYNRTHGFFRVDIYQQNVHRNWYKLNKIDAGNGMTSLSSILMNPLDYATEFNGLQGLGSDSTRLELKANNRYYLSQGVQVKGQYSDRIASFTLKHEAGARIHYDHIDYFQHSDVYRFTLNTFEKQIEGTPGSAGNKLNGTWAQSAYYRSTIRRNQLSGQFGLRAENILATGVNFGTDYQRKDTPEATSNHSFVLIPGASITYATPNWNYFIGAHRGFTPAGAKPEVLPETSIATELGMAHKRLPIAITAYQSLYEQLLGADMAAGGGSGTGELYNGGSAVVKGLEAQWGQTVKSIRMEGNLSYTQAHFTESFESSFEGWGDVNAGDPLPYLPAFTGSYTVQWTHKKLSAAVQQQVLSARTSSASLGTNDLPASSVVNINAAYSWNAFAVQLAVQNLTNTQHVVAARPVGYRNFAPRMIVASLVWNFKEAEKK